jgi:hypothetical protein
MVFLRRYIAHQTDYCTFGLDEYKTNEGQQMLLAHLHVHKWSPSYLKRIKRDWQTFRSVVRVPLYASPANHDVKWERFVTLMGWRPFSTVLCHDGIERPLYIHTV